MCPAARGRGEVDGAQPVALGQQQLGRADVLADRAHVLPRRGGGADLRHVVLPVHVLAHDDGVEALGQRVAGVDDAKRVDARGAVSVAPNVSAARTAIPSIAAAS